LYIRLKIEETPVFRQALDAAKPVRVPVRDALSAQWRQILLVAGMLSALFGFFYIATVFVTGYAGRNPKGVPPGILGFSTTTILTVQIFAAMVFFGTIALTAMYSDRIGRRRVVLFGTAFGIPMGLFAIPVMNQGGTAAFAAGVFMLLAIVGLAYGPLAAFLPELFDTRYRYTGAGLGYNLGGVLGGAIPILVANEMLREWGSNSIGYYLAGLATLSTLCVLALPETKAADLSVEPATVRVPVPAGASV
ncbi:MAG: MFS transporter, partial [Gemmatimonadales bacterium]